MTDEQTRQDTSAENSTKPASAGSMLTAGRERLNLTTAQVAERLRLRQQIVIDLENDQFDKYVAGTFTRGYLRAYARLVNVDESQVLAAYEAIAVEDKPQQMQSFSRRTRQQSQDNRLMLVTYIIGAIIIGSAVIFWLQNNNEENSDITTQRQQDTVAERMIEEQDAQVDIEPRQDEEFPAATREPIFIDTTLVDPDAPAQTVTEVELTENTTEDSVVEGTEQVPEQQAIADAEPAEQAERAREQAQAEATEPPPATGGEGAPTDTLPDTELVLVFEGDAWIRIEDASGEAIAFGVKPEGHVSALDGQAPYEVTLGAPENVSLYFQGNQIDLSSYRAGRVARLTIPATE